VSRASALICLIATAVLCGRWSRQRTHARAFLYLDTESASRLSV
jgi:hypothetical protein